MTDNKGFFGALWHGDLAGAVGSLMAGIVHLVAAGLFILVLGLTAPLLALLMPFYAYYCTTGLFTIAYFVLGGFASAMFTNIVHCRITWKERRARGETFGQHCRSVAGWPTLSIIGSWAAGYVFYRIFHHSLLGYGSSREAHFTFFALAPVALFAPLWAYLLHRRRQQNRAGEVA